MPANCGDRVEVRVARPPENREDKLWGKIVDFFGDTVLTQLYEEGKPAVRRSFKRSQLRPGGEKTWKVTDRQGGGRRSGRDAARGFRLSGS
jgi:hypothetical protein